VAWSPYKTCCPEAARQPAYALCDECGHVLLRCIGYEDCQTLVEPKSHCHTCVQPQLSLDTSSMPVPMVGDRLALNFVFANPAASRQPLRCEAVEAFINGTATPVDLAWNEVEAGGERRFSVSTPPLEHGGQFALRLLLTVATRHKDREEIYMFETLGQVGVERVGGQVAPQIVISGNVSDNALINIAGLGGQDANTSPKMANGAAEPRIASKLQRADGLERVRGLRGHGAAGPRVLRDVRFRFSGFRAEECPPADAVLGAKGLLTCGRAEQRFNATENPEPNDIVLRIYEADGQTLDETASRQISRRHFDILVMNDRLCLRVQSLQGLEVSGTHAARGALVTLADGDLIVPRPELRDRLALRVRFNGHHGDIETVELVRVTGGTGRGAR